MHTHRFSACGCQQLSALNLTHWAPTSSHSPVSQVPAAAPITKHQLWWVLSWSGGSYTGHGTSCSIPLDTNETWINIQISHHAVHHRVKCRFLSVSVFSTVSVKCDGYYHDFSYCVPDAVCWAAPGWFHWASVRGAATYSKASTDWVHWLRPLTGTTDWDHWQVPLTGTTDWVHCLHHGPFNCTHSTIVSRSLPQWTQTHTHSHSRRVPLCGAHITSYFNNKQITVNQMEIMKCFVRSDLFLEILVIKIESSHIYNWLSITNRNIIQNEQGTNTQKNGTFFKLHFNMTQKLHVFTQSCHASALQYVFKETLDLLDLFLWPCCFPLVWFLDLCLCYFHHELNILQFSFLYVSVFLISEHSSSCLCLPSHPLWLPVIGFLCVSHHLCIKSVIFSLFSVRFSHQWSSVWPNWGAWPCLSLCVVDTSAWSKPVCQIKDWVLELSSSGVCIWLLTCFSFTRT